MRVKRAALLMGALVAAITMFQFDQPEASATGITVFQRPSKIETLQSALDSTAAELDITRATLARAEKILHFSGRFGVSADLAANVYDAALAEGIDPELGFRVVRLESGFNPHAISPVGALGLTQLMLPTAKQFDEHVTREKLFNAKTNLHIGFRYLRDLIRQYDDDVRLALLVYNRGPTAVNAAVARGEDPANGYERIVMKGYQGSGVVD
jgi:soluble lytic murein transglycosylase-like protein